jgi:hypothetical protein
MLYLAPSYLSGYFFLTFIPDINRVCIDSLTGFDVIS